MAGLLEQPVALGLGLLKLTRRVRMRLRQQLARLVPRRVEHVGALALALLAVPLDVGLALLKLALAPAHFLLGATELRGGRVLRVALDRVGELGGGADHVQRVHADGVARRLDRGGGARSGAGDLEHAQLRLQLGCVAAEGVERLPYSLRVEPFPGLRDVLDAGQRR